MGQIAYIVIIGIKLENRPKKTQNFCLNARKRRRRVPKGTLEGADAAFEQKGKFYGMVFKFNAYSLYISGITR